MDQAGLAALLDRHGTRHRVPGATIGVLRDDAATTACWGVASSRTGEPVSPQTMFSLGSLTKPMVATVISRLAQSGRLSFDDEVAAHVPELRGCAWARRATLRDLLANRSGLPLSAALEFGFDDRPEQDDGALARLVGAAASDTRVESSWSYSNVGWCVLGRVIESVTDATWDDAMRAFFADAALDQTTVAIGPAANRATGHELTADGAVPVEPLSARAYGPAGTTVVSTVTDLLRFASLHLHDASVVELRTVHAEIAIHGWLDAWCLGWAKFDWAGGPVWGWDGLVNGERSVLRLLPEQRTAVALMTNGGNGRAMYRSSFAELMPTFGVDIPPLSLAGRPGAAGDLTRFAGVYAWPDRRLVVAPARDRLLIVSEQGEIEALPLDARSFLVDASDPDAPSVTFGDFDEAGRPLVLYDMLWGMPRSDE